MKPIRLDLMEINKKSNCLMTLNQRMINLSRISGEEIKRRCGADFCRAVRLLQYGDVLVETTHKQFLCATIIPYISISGLEKEIQELREDEGEINHCFSLSGDETSKYNLRIRRLKNKYNMALLNTVPLRLSKENKKLLDRRSKKVTNYEITIEKTY